MYKGLLKELKDLLKQLPGVGEKSAQRFVIYLIGHNKSLAQKIAKAISEAVQRYDKCTVCGMLTTETECEFCADSTRDRKTLCIVQNSSDVYLIEDTNAFKGRYFVTDKLLSPLEGIGPDDLKLDKLLELISKENVKEVILALNPSPEGETTITFLADLLKDYDLKITRLSTGIPFGSDIEYTSAMTLSNAVQRRFTI